MQRKVYDEDGHAHYITFSCYKNRRLLDYDQVKRVVIHFLGKMLEIKNGHCLGFVIMPDHVHAIVWFDENNKLAQFMQQWKRRTAYELNKFYEASGYFKASENTQAFWQAGYYDFNLYSENKIREKISYMHMNPVRAGLVEETCKWKYSSARWYEEGKPVGINLGIP